MSNPERLSGSGGDDGPCRIRVSTSSRIWHFALLKQGVVNQPSLLSGHISIGSGIREATCSGSQDKVLRHGVLHSAESANILPIRL